MARHFKSLRSSLLKNTADIWFFGLPIYFLVWTCQTENCCSKFSLSRYSALLRPTHLILLYSREHAIFLSIKGPLVSKVPSLHVGKLATCTSFLLVDFLICALSTSCHRFYACYWIIGLIWIDNLMMMSCFRRLQDLGNYRFGFTICGSWTRELKKPRRRWGAKHVISYMFFSQWRWIFWKQHGIVVVVSITKMMTMKFGIENITTFCFCTSFEGASFQRYGRGFWSFQELLGLWDIRSAAAWTTNRLQKTPIHSTVQTHPGHSIRAEHHSSTPDLKPSNQLAEALFAFIWSGSVRLTQSRCCHLQTCRG